MTLYFVAGTCFVIIAIVFFEAGVFSAKRGLTFEKRRQDNDIQLKNNREEVIRERLIDENQTLKQNYNILKEKSDAYRKSTQQHLDELRKQLANARSILSGYKKRLKNLVAKVTQVNSERVRLTERLKVVEKDLQEIPALEKKNNELTHALDLLNAKLKELDLLQNEIEPPPSPISRQKIINATVKTPETADTSADNASAGRNGLGGALQEMVNRISQMDGSLGVVVADELGLLVAGIGEHMENLAAMAAVYSDIHRNVTALVPFGEIELIRIRGLENLNLTMQPFKLESEKLVLTAFTSGKAPDRSLFEQFTRQLITA